MQETADQSGKRARGPAKAFPIRTFQDALDLSKAIEVHGSGNRIRRITLFGQIERSPNSRQSRDLITSSGRYGLTEGGYQADYLVTTADAKTLVHEEASPTELKQKEFKLSIGLFTPFTELYEKRKNARLPADSVLLDDVGESGVPVADRELALNVFLANCQRLGLIKEIGGNNWLLPIEQIIEESQGHEGAQGASSEQPAEVVRERPASRENPPPGETNVLEPSLHIDIQIHIDSTASAEQIDQIFSSMARHLYRLDV